MAAQTTEIYVSMIHPEVWDNELEVFEITDPIPVFEWLEKIAPPEYEVFKLPYESSITGGAYAGGQVISVYQGDDRLLFALPPAAIPLLEGRMPDKDLKALVNQTPALRGIRMPEQVESAE